MFIPFVLIEFGIFVLPLFLHLALILSLFLWVPLALEGNVSHLENFSEVPELGRFILVKKGKNVGAGIVLEAGILVPLSV